MSTWVQNISWDSSAIGGMTTAPAATTMAPTTMAPTTPATVAPSYPMNPNYGGGGVIFPLPVAPSLLMDGDISALSPITPAPTTAAPLPDTLAPIPPMNLSPIAADDDDEKPYWTWQRIALLLGFFLVVGVVVWWFFLRKGSKNNRNTTNNGANRNGTKNVGWNKSTAGGSRNNARAKNTTTAGYNYNDTLDNWSEYYNTTTPGGNNAKRP